MTAANSDEEVFDIQLDPITKDEHINMICTHCGYEEEMPEWCYAEEADFLIEEGDPEPPTWQCPKCYEETLVRKPD